MYVLSVVAVVCLQLGFYIGLLGDNVGGVSGAESPYGFVAFILILMLLVVLQVWFIVKKPLSR
jgi:zinc transporter